VVTSSFDMPQIESALQSSFLKEGYVWDSDRNDWWYRYAPPSPKLFAFYDLLLHGDTYQLVAVFERPFPRIQGAEFSASEIKIYVRRQVLN
jgi:hypothetical protein